jgi:hypothetical protein
VQVKLNGISVQKLNKSRIVAVTYDRLTVVSVTSHCHRSVQYCRVVLLVMVLAGTSSTSDCILNDSKLLPFLNCDN